MQAFYPRRITTIHTEQLGAELCIYDWKRNRVHRLNPASASVWLQCDGATTPAQMAANLPSALRTAADAEAIVWLALAELTDARLLRSGPARPADPQAVSRRQLIKQLGKAGVLLPAITSIAAPTPVEAQSATSQTFSFTGAAQVFVVPFAITRVTIAAYGAAGGASGGPGGPGGLVTATIPVTPGETLNVFVGGEGMDHVAPFGNGGFNGGGNSIGAGGGGASDVRRGTTKLVIAGGGGGTATGGLGQGAPGGGLTGADGQPGFNSAGGGAGGTQSAGGAGGTAGINGTPGTSGSPGIGGDAGHILGTPLVAAGGGGGGGYFGGGGGGGGWSATGFQSLGSGGGGGGSSFAIAAASGVTHQQGVNSGNGKVVISFA